MPSRSSPPSALAPENLAALARLAHLELTADETTALAADLTRILDYVRQLEELDVSAVPATAHGRLERLPLREDEPHVSLPRELALREAPRVDQGGFAVPAFVDEG